MFKLSPFTQLESISIQTIKCHRMMSKLMKQFSSHCQRALIKYKYSLQEHTVYHNNRHCLQTHLPRVKFGLFLLLFLLQPLHVFWSKFTWNKQNSCQQVLNAHKILFPKHIHSENGCKWMLPWLSSSGATK